MIDLAKLLDQFEPGLASGCARGSGHELGNFPNQEFQQSTEKIDISHISQFPTAKRERYKDYSHALTDSDCGDQDGCVARDTHACGVGNVGTAGNPSENNDLPFPLIDIELGNWEKGGEASAGAIEKASPRAPAPPRVGPRRSDWWTGPAMAEADRLALPAEPLPISPADVRAGIERELRALAEDGREGPAALRDAIAITAAKIRNSEALVERQASGAACHVCNGPLDDSAPVVAVLTARRGGHLYMHAGCCDAFGARRAALVAEIMASAGYGAEPIGDAA